MGRRAHTLAGALLVTMLWASSGCCRIVELLSKPVPRKDDDALPVPEEDGRDNGDAPPRRNAIRGRIDLGTAAFPAGNDADVTLHDWTSRPNLSPRSYRLGYQLADDSEHDSENDYHRWAKRMGHRKIAENRFQWRPAPRCRGGLHCVYERLAAQDRDAIEPLVELFRDRIQSAGLNTLQATALVVTFGQEIHYEIPRTQPFGILPPAVVVDRNTGDCDSKSLLVHMILRRLGIDSVLISSKKHAHTMLGVALAAPGATFTYHGRRYAFVELTAKRSPIGQINPTLLRPNDWRVDPLPYSVERKSRGNSSGEPATPRRGSRQVETPMNALVGGRIRIRRR